MHRRSRLRLLLAAAAAFVALGLAPAAAQPRTPAQDPAATPPADGDGEVVHSWALAPATGAGDAGGGSRSFFSYELEPGSVIEDAVTLFNLGTVPLTFDVYGTDARNNEAGDFELLAAEFEPTGLGSWIESSATVLTVAPQSEVRIPITIRVPVDARPGDHAGAILAASPVQGTSPDGRQVVLDRRTGPRVYIRVAGELTPELSVEGIETSYDLSLNPLGGAATVRYHIHNTGNVRLSGQHHVSVAGPFGAGRVRSATLDLPELLPGGSIPLEAVLDGVPALGLARTEVVVEPSTELGADADLEPVTGRGFALAPPVTVLLGGLAAGCALLARRAYLRRQRALTVGASPT